jgi:hypothetical protein
MIGKSGLKRGASAMVFLLLAGCAAGSAMASLPTARARTMTAEWLSQPSETPPPADTATPTVTPTATEIPTVQPMVTPSPGPAPDLEIMNVNIYNDKSNQSIFMGEIRNNTSEAMIFPAKEARLRLNIEEWESWGYRYYYHLYDVNIQPYESYFYRRMPCILYPGETGVLTFNLGQVCIESHGCEGGIIDELSTPPKQLGYRLNGYKAFPRRWEDLKGISPFTEYYPVQLDDRINTQALNLTYRIQGLEIIVEFDVDAYVPIYAGVMNPSAWIVLFGKQGDILDILTGFPTYCEGVGCFDSKRYHLYGVGNNSGVLTNKSATPGVYIDWFHPVVKLTPEILQQVDHIQVFNEIGDGNLCEDKIYDS